MWCRLLNFPSIFSPSYFQDLPACGVSGTCFQNGGFCPYHFSFGRCSLNVCLQDIWKETLRGARAQCECGFTAKIVAEAHYND